MIVTATVNDYDDWKSSFDDYTPKREEHGVREHRIYRSTDDPNEIIVVLEFEGEENARAWNEYLEGQDELSGPEMADVEVTYFDLVESQSKVPPVE